MTSTSVQGPGRVGVRLPSGGNRPGAGTRTREHRAAAVAAGILYITGTVAGVAGMTVTNSVRAAADPLAAAAQHPGVLVTGALLVLVMGLSLALVPVVLFPVLRKADEVLAVGYLVVRGAVETLCYCVLAIGLLLALPVGEILASGSGTGSSAGVRMGSILVEAEAANAVLALVFLLGAALFYVLLYRSRIVPRWIAGWGLAAIPFYVAATVLAMYSVIEANSSTQTMLFMPLAIQEMVLAGWMIGRGFRPAVGAATSGHASARVEAPRASSI